MIFLIATMAASTWLSIKLRGHVQTLGGISSISSMGNPKDFEWLRNRTKPTARQISISKSLTESMVKQNLCWTGHFIPPPPTENASNTLSFERGPWGERGPGRAARARAKTAPILRPFARRAQDPIHPEDFFKGNLLLYKVASPGKTPEKIESMLEFIPPGHFIPPPQTENEKTLWKNTFFTWNGHFIPPPPTENASIKWPVQVKMCFFRGFTWTGHFIEKKISLERGPQGEWGPGQLYKVIWVMYLMTL